MKSKKIFVSCPKCKKPFSYYQSEFRPFCSERCKLVDLSKWLNEDYKIVSENTDEKENPPLINDENENSQT